MSSILDVRVLLIITAVLIAATLGCSPSSDTENVSSESSTAGDNRARTGDDASDQIPPTPIDAGSPRAAGTLSVGDPAPPLSISKWVTGDPIAENLETGQVYVIEFWATWCPPCRTSMPHLSTLQDQYGDQVKFVGVTRENDAVVQSFLAKDQAPGKTWKEAITYRLALDNQDATNNAYMRAAGQNGIPCAFIVGREGKVEWIGHPMAMEEALKKVVGGA
jgi:thiol-disulfide isomerase/thioredoxin